MSKYTRIEDCFRYVVFHKNLVVMNFLNTSVISVALRTPYFYGNHFHLILRGNQDRIQYKNKFSDFDKSTLFKDLRMFWKCIEWYKKRMNEVKLSKF